METKRLPGEAVEHAMVRLGHMLQQRDQQADTAPFAKVAKELNAACPASLGKTL